MTATPESRPESSPTEPTVLGEGEPPPQPGLNGVIREVRKGHREVTRRHIALILVAALVALTAVGATGWLIWGSDTARMQNFAIVFSPITTLFGTVIGFYFSSGDKPK